MSDVMSVVFEEEEAVADRVWRIGGVRSGVIILLVVISPVRTTSGDFKFLNRGDPSGSSNVSVSESK